MIGRRKVKVNLVSSEKRRIPVPDGAKCFNCLKKAETMHHIIPYSYGGRIAIPMCSSCHYIAHHGKGLDHNHGDLIKKGLQKAKANGKKLGPPITTNKDIIKKLLKKPGFSYSKIARIAKCSKSTVCRVAKKMERDS